MYSNPWFWKSELMPSEDSFHEKGSGRRNHAAFFVALWPRLIELWIAGVLIAFFVVRVLGSQTARGLLNHLGRRPLQ
jgi:hypothetical protein